eukprot:TRINITY_DN1509_c0_g1::TRINITY_DN1509_c0_g1_i1::g.28286::m.28286 TRINITY_DN1509_c0_g1::TRINITY_DN1509_c0_g1_i1::g.28286  ORF type:complete len:522 (+),score=66.72,sp/P12617/DCMC_ANSAN/40.64/1e-79,MCD/PF05292.6/1.5e-95,Acyl_transf_1/PF00698.16/0.034 TRINITY_DN1509_c0_g1_i1:89-1654(+)
MPGAIGRMVWRALRPICPLSQPFRSLYPHRTFAQKIDPNAHSQGQERGGVRSPLRHVIKTRHTFPDHSSDDNSAVDSLANHVDQLIKMRSSPLGDSVPRIIVQSILEEYQTLHFSARLRFLETLATNFTVDVDVIEKAVKARESDSFQSKDYVLRATYDRQLRDSLTPLYELAFQQIHIHPHGIHFLVDLRGDMLHFISKGEASENVKVMDDNLKRMLESWFSGGLLELSELSWDSPASLLEKIIHYERVHPISDWSDLKHRLGDARRLYAFFHPNMPHEPLVFVEVAFLPELAQAMGKILRAPVAPTWQKDATTAIFYSISATQAGLAGVELGNFLIKRVVHTIQTDVNLKHITNFATLSPIPAFSKFLDSFLSSDLDDSCWIPASIATTLQAKTACTSPKLALKQILSKTGWEDDSSVVQMVKPVLMHLAARYLVREQVRKRAIDPVANFHIRNGARVERINWMADTSHKGLKNSLGMMVNYKYVLDDVETNNEEYMLQGKIPYSTQIKDLLDWKEAQL